MVIVQERCDVLHPALQAAVEHDLAFFGDERTDDEVGLAEIPGEGQAAEIGTELHAAVVLVPAELVLVAFRIVEFLLRGLHDRVGFHVLAEVQLRTPHGKVVADGNGRDVLHEEVR